MWRLATVRIDCRTDDVGVGFGHDVGPTVTGTTGTIENSSDEVLAHREFEHVTHELDTCVEIYTSSSFKHLYNDEVVTRIENLAILHGAIGQSHLYDFSESNRFCLV